MAPPSSHRRKVTFPSIRTVVALNAVGAHAVIGGVALPNEASVRLHEKFGFEKCAHFREVGFKFNRWIDVAYRERII